MADEVADDIEPEDEARLADLYAARDAALVRVNACDTSLSGPDAASPGVYVLLGGSDPIYVGKARSLICRVAHHYQDRRDAYREAEADESLPYGRLDFDAVSCVSLPFFTDKGLLAVEGAMIRVLLTSDKDDGFNQTDPMRGRDALARQMVSVALDYAEAWIAGNEMDPAESLSKIGVLWRGRPLRAGGDRVRPAVPDKPRRYVRPAWATAS